MQRVFDIRQSHPMPTELGTPPGHWADPYREMATEIGLAESDHRQAHEIVAGHWATTRAGTASAGSGPGGECWTTGGGRPVR